MDELAICCIAKNEGRYIGEWLSYHHAVGVRRFLIYDNNSTDDMRAQIAAWPFRDLVTVIDWPEVPGQIASYHHALANFRSVAQWCAFIDIDEFLTPQTGLGLLNILRNVRALCGGLYVHWLMFGSSGHLSHEPGLVTQRFTRRGHESFGPNVIGKTIVRMSEATLPENPHVIGCRGRLINDNNETIDQKNYVIAHPTCAGTGAGDRFARALRNSPSTGRALALAVLTTERKAA